MPILTASQISGILKGDKISWHNGKDYKVLGATGNTLNLRPWRWWDTLAAFLRRSFYRLTHR